MRFPGDVFDVEEEAYFLGGGGSLVMEDVNALPLEDLASEDVLVV